MSSAWSRRSTRNLRSALELGAGIGTRGASRSRLAAALCAVLVHARPLGRGSEASSTARCSGGRRRGLRRAPGCAHRRAPSSRSGNRTLRRRAASERGAARSSRVDTRVFGPRRTALVRRSAIVANVERGTSTTPVDCSSRHCRSLDEAGDQRLDVDRPQQPRRRRASTRRVRARSPADSGKAWCVQRGHDGCRKTLESAHQPRRWQTLGLGASGRAEQLLRDGSSRRTRSGIGDGFMMGLLRNWRGLDSPKRPELALPAARVHRGRRRRARERGTTSFEAPRSDRQARWERTREAARCEWRRFAATLSRRVESDVAGATRGRHRLLRELTRATALPA